MPRPPIVPRIRRYFGWTPSLPDIRDHVYNAPPDVLAALPESVDLSFPSPGPPFDPCYNQGSIGSCGPNTAAGGLSYEQIEEAGANDVMPSRLFVYWTTRYLMGTVNSDSGVQNRTLMKALQQYGWCDEKLWPYDTSKYKQRPPDACFQQAASRRITEYQSVPQNLDQMKGCLASKNTILFGFTVYDDIYSDEVERTGDIPMPTAGSRAVGGHDVLLVGYNNAQQRFKLKNSWGESWGLYGYGSIPYAYALNSRLAQDFWTWLRSGRAPETPPPEPPVVQPVEIEVPQAGTYRLVTG